MTADNFATQARDELRTKLIDVIDNRRFDENYPKGLLYKKIEYVIDLLLPTVEAALRQTEEALLDRVEQEVIREVPVAVTDLPTESEHGQLMERIRIRKDLKALRSERQAGTE